MTTLTIAHITDIHITSQPNEPFHGVNVHDNFCKVLDAVQAKQPDTIIIGGDLAATDGDEAIYSWVRKQLDSINIPYHIMAGNHDHIGLLSKVFGQSNRHTENDWYLRIEYSDRIIICLDSSPYTISRTQLSQLKEDLSNQAKEVLIFIHHPPVLANCVFMDTKYALKNHEEVMSFFADLPQIKYIICGHYHTEKSLVVSNKLVLITPSTFVQISQDHQDFTISDYGPGWRWIEWGKHHLNTSVFYLDTHNK